CSSTSFTPTCSATRRTCCWSRCTRCSARRRRAGSGRCAARAAVRDRAGVPRLLRLLHRYPRRRGPQPRAMREPGRPRRLPAARRRRRRGKNRRRRRKSRRKNRTTSSTPTATRWSTSRPRGRPASSRLCICSRRRSARRRSANWTTGRLTDSQVEAEERTVQPNLQQLMQQAQKMQQQMAEAQAELAEAEVTGTAGGGLVTVTAKGTGDVTAIKIDPKAVDPDDVETLEDLVLAAIHNAMEAV